ncbi:hypothetical protein WN943_027250 [Citrus x changshan-huyou]
MALDKANAKIEKAKELENEFSTAREQIESMLDLNYEEYLKGLKNCLIMLIEGDGSKTCINEGDTVAQGILTRPRRYLQLYQKGSRIFSGGTLYVHLMSNSLMTFNILGISKGFPLA